jgi:hypothetical protein
MQKHLRHKRFSKRIGVLRQITFKCLSMHGEKLNGVAG